MECALTHTYMDYIDLYVRTHIHRSTTDMYYGPSIRSPMNKKREKKQRSFHAQV